jgi:hypothetical protein
VGAQLGTAPQAGHVSPARTIKAGKHLGRGRAGPGQAVLDPGLPDELSKRSPLATAWRARPHTYPVHRRRAGRRLAET